jgi:S1-C subfamily serine protease
VVKVYATRRAPDFVAPWSKGSPHEGSGSGVVIDGKRILTNAHVVLYANQIFVQGSQSTDRVPAKATAVAPGMDLAILEVERRSFFDDHPPLAVADDIPAMKQTVNVYGFPIGGEQMSVTQGIVSRIEYTNINFLVEGLRIQIDAALNPGNSGGPAVSEGKITGLVYSKNERGENIGYLIAAEEIRMFLHDIRDGVYHGKLQLWDYLGPTQNEALRAKLGLEKQSGAMVYAPYSTAADYPLKKWDVVTRIGGHPLDSEGQVKIRDDLRLSFEYFVPKMARQGRVRLAIVRDGKTREVDAPVRTDGNFVVPFLAGKYPRYFIYGPMVFVPASQELLHVLTDVSFASRLIEIRSPLLARGMDHPAFDGEEIVTLGCRLLPHKISKGYELSPFSVVSRVNGTAVRNLSQAVELLRDAKGEFLTIELAGASPPLVFRRSELLPATEDVLSDEAVRKPYSDDLESVWHRAK